MGPLHRLHVARQQLLEAERRAGGAGGAGLGGRSGLLRGAGGDHLLDPRLDPAPQLLAVDGQADEHGRAAKLRRPELLASRGGSMPARWSSSARAIRLRSLG